MSFSKLQLALLEEKQFCIFIQKEKKGSHILINWEGGIGHISRLTLTDKIQICTHRLHTFLLKYY